MGLQWECGYCGRPTTLTAPHHDSRGIGLDVKGLENGDNFEILYLAISCPNPKCQKLTLNISLYNKGKWEAGPDGKYRNSKRELVKSWDLLPEPQGKPQPEYIPASIKEDYYEACRIRELSPKASASLSRRCLQGMIRDFWQVTGKRNLWEEIEAIQDKVDPDIWEAVDGVRKIGNVGAHMEKDVNLIIDIDPGEAEALINLIEVLFEEWYVARDMRNKRVSRVKDIAKDKTGETSQKKENKEEKA